MTDYAPEAGDVVWTDFSPRTGREQGGRRPALVVSPREFYDGTRFLVVCPITSRIRPFGSSVVLPAGSIIAGEILVAQLRSLDALARPIVFSGMRIDPRSSFRRAKKDRFFVRRLRKRPRLPMTVDLLIRNAALPDGRRGRRGWTPPITRRAREHDLMGGPMRATPGR